MSLALAACGPLVDLGETNAPPPRIYDIAPQGLDSTSTAGLARPLVLLIEEPMTSGILDRERIAVRFESGEIQYLSGLRLADRPTRLVRRSLQNHLAAIDGLTVLGRGALDVPSDYRLKLFLLDFQINAGPGNTEQTRVALDALLLNDRGELVSVERFKIAQDIPAARPAAAVGGLRDGLAAAAEDMRRWLLETLQ
ncbi:MAG: ABC-type transport auxiliary lipoprotein family protein [Pseudomonadota bacterium]